MDPERRVKQIITATLTLASGAACQLVEQHVPTSSPELLTIDSASVAIHAWDTFTNGVNHGEIGDPITCATNPDDQTGTLLQGFHPANPDGTPNEALEYGFCNAPVTIDGKSEGFAVFLVQQDTQTHDTEAFILLLEGEGNGPEGTWVAGKIDADHNVTAAGFSVVFDGTNFFIVTETEEAVLGVNDKPEATAQAAQTISQVIFKRERPAFDMTATPSAVVTPVETPVADKPVVLFADMTPEGGAEQCAQNTLDLDSPTFDAQLQAMMDSIRAQAGEPVTNVLLRVIPGTYPGANIDIYPRASLYFQSLSDSDNAPIVGCAEAQLGDATARVQFVDSFPFPKAGGGTEPITFGLISEPDAIQKIMTASMFTHAGDTTVFPALQEGQRQVRLEFYINPYVTQAPGDPAHEAFREATIRRIEKTGSIIVPQLFNEQEAQRFSELFIKVFYDGDRSPEVLSELKTLMSGKLLPGFIFIDEP